MIGLNGFDITFNEKEQSLKDRLLGKYRLYKVFSPAGIINGFEEHIPEGAKNIRIKSNKEKAEHIGSCNKSFVYHKETRYKLLELFKK